MAHGRIVEGDVTLVASPDAASARATYRRIWQLGWPVSISTSTVTLLTLVNLLWIGHLGTDAVAAVSLSGNILFILFGIANVVHAGALAIVARRVGERHLTAALAATIHGVLLGAALGVIVAITGYISTPAIVGFFGVGAAVEAIAVPYLRIFFLGQIPLFINVALSAAYQASGDTRAPMRINILVVAINALVDPFFIFAPGEITLAGIPLGWLGWHTDGAAIAASASGAVGCIIFVATSIARGRPFSRAAGRSLELSLAQCWTMLRIGTPASLSMVARPLSTFLLLKVVASFGTAAIAAFGIAVRAFSVNFIPYAGINIAIASLVGQSLGSGRIGDARHIVRRGLMLTTLLGIFFCLVYYAFAREIILAFDHEPAVLAAAEPFVKLMALAFLFSGPMFPLVSAMNGAGDTKPPMIVALLANWPLKLPLAYWLALPMGWGVNGVWLGIFVSVVFETLAVACWYRRGTWLAKRI